MTTTAVTRRTLFLAAVVSSFVIAVSSISASTHVAQNSLPKVGTIKDYPATGLMTGCGNLYFHKASVGNPTVREGAVTGGTLPNDRVSATNAPSGDPNYVFLSRGDGTDAWLNLNGRDVRLRKIKSAAGPNQKVRRFLYRYRNVRITVDFEDFAPDRPGGESDPMFKMKITLRNGRAVRVVQAIGDADC